MNIRKLDVALGWVLGLFFLFSPLGLLAVALWVYPVRQHLLPYAVSTGR